jgi:hypothetical protein
LVVERKNNPKLGYPTALAGHYQMSILEPADSRPDFALSRAEESSQPGARYGTGHALIICMADEPNVYLQRHRLGHQIIELSSDHDRLLVVRTVTVDGARPLPGSMSM